MLIELLLMGAMYPNKKWNALIATASVVALMTFWACIRQQVGISDKQFLKSMIPHHARAILMCENSSIKDLEIRELCRQIPSGQRREIDQKKAKLNEQRLAREEKDLCTSRQFFSATALAILMASARLP